jgi:hypothetical protein
MMEAHGRRQRGTKFRLLLKLYISVNQTPARDGVVLLDNLTSSCSLLLRRIMDVSL